MVAILQLKASKLIAYFVSFTVVIFTILKSYPQLQSPFIATPPDVGVDIDLMMNKLSTFVVTTVRTSDVKVNLNRDQLAGFKSLKSRKIYKYQRVIKVGFCSI